MTEAFQPELLEIENESHKHAGHSGDDGSGESHFRVMIRAAGFAGLSAATLLARRGHRVTVLEKFSQPQAVGAGILVQPTGGEVLKVDLRPAQ